MICCAIVVLLLGVDPLTIHVAPSGSDVNPGTEAKPLASLARARDVVRESAGKRPVTVLLHAGTYYLPETLTLRAEDSGTADAPVVYAAAPGEHPVISGATRLQLDWTPAEGNVVHATTPAGLQIDQLFLDSKRLPMARYPNYDPNGGQFDGSAADAIDAKRVARWANPAGGFIHAMHVHLWGDMHWRILGKSDDGTLRYQGGWQNNRPSAMHRQFRFVENIREELDAPGEWFHDAAKNTLWLVPRTGVDLKSAAVEVVRLRHLIELHGLKEKPLKHVTIRGLTFRHASRTFMENREPLLRSDWTVYRGGALRIDGAEDVSIEDCDFDQLGGNAVFVNAYNRRIHVRGCLIREAGANGVAFVGDPRAVRDPRFNYASKIEYDKLDRTPGPISDEYPADCVVEDCLITRTGRFEKQTAPVQIAMAQGISVRHCTINDVPRAGINIGDGCWGGHVIEFCDVFDTVKETGDHGSFNSWGRDRYWDPDVKIVDKQVEADPALPLLDALKTVVLRNNRWRCDHGWDVDLDDGSTNFRIENNVFLNGGLKLREGYKRFVNNNVIVNNSFHPHVWFTNSGDVFTHNIVMGPYQPAIMKVAHWGKEIDHNLFTTNDADRKKFAAQGCDGNSVVGDPLFVDPEKGDFRVKPGSPALALGFVNFPMEGFGVRSSRLRSLAKTPEIPKVKSLSEPPGGVKPVLWQGATLRALSGQEFSVVGVSEGSQGVYVAESPASSKAFAAGLRTGDFIEKVNGKGVRNAKEFVEVMGKVGEGFEVEVVRMQQRRELHFAPGK